MKWEYIALSIFVAFVSVALVFMLMNVDYSDSCSTSATDLKNGGLLGYTPYMYGAICDDFAWKQYTAGLWTAICFVIGAGFSAAAGYAGMFIATKANTRASRIILFISLT